MSESKVIEAPSSKANEGRDAAYNQESPMAAQLTAAWSKLQEQAKTNEAAIEAAKVVEPDRRYDKNRDPDKDPLPKSPKEKVFEKPSKTEAKVEAPKVEAKIEAKTEAAKVDVDDAPPEAKSEEAKSSWAKLKAARDEAMQKASAAEAELLALKQQYDPDSFKKTKEENDQLTEALRRLNVELHPKFKETFDAPIEQAVNRAKKFVPTEYHAEVDKWLKAPDSVERDQALQTITEALPVHKQAAFVRHVEDASIALEKKATALQNEREFVSKWESDQKAQQEAARVQSEAFARNTFQNVLKSKFADNPVFNGEGSEVNVKAAQDLLFGNNSPEALAEAVLYSQYGKQVAPLLKQAHDELKAAYAQIDRLTSKAGGKAVGSGGDSAPKDMWSAIREAMAA